MMMYVAQTQNEFKPLSEVGQAEQMPAAPMVATAYAFVWVALLVYMFGLWRKLGRVEQELADVARRVAQPRR